MADETLTTHAEDGIATGDVVAPHGSEGVLGRRTAQGKDQPDLGPPSFAELVWAHYLWRRQLQELETRQARRELHVPLEAAYRRRLAAFERFNGLIVDAYWCRSEASAVAITAKPAKPFARNVMRRSSTMRFHSATDWKTARSPVIATLMQDCETLAIRAGEVLNGTSQRIAIRWVMSVASFLLARCDMEPPRAQDKRRASTQVRAHVAPELRVIENYYLQAATKRARMVYVWGMVQGIIAISALIATVGVYMAIESRPALHDPSAQQLAATLAAGAVGALISVLMRMDERRTSTFKIDAEIGGRAVRRLGLFRTTVGAILATAVFFALKAGLLQQITIPQSPRAIYFFLFVAFLAGFSERWAQIVLGGAEGVLTPMPQQQAAPSTDGAPPQITRTPGNGTDPTT